MGPGISFQRDINLFTSWSTRTYLNNLYDEFYKTGIDYECLRVNALINARKSLDRDDVPSAEKYLEQSYTYNKLSYMSFTAAFEVYDAALDAGEILAEGIKNGCEASRRIVTLALKITNPVAAKAADYVFVAVDYAVDYRLFGEDEAIKNAIVKIAVMVTFDEIKYEGLGARTISEFTRDRIGEVTFPILQNVFKSEVSVYGDVLSSQAWYTFLYMSYTPLRSLPAHNRSCNFSECINLVFSSFHFP